MQIIGIMTGNSLDAADFVLTEFENGHIRDLAAHTEPFSAELTEKIQNLRQLVQQNQADMKALAKIPEFMAGINDYTLFVAQSLNNWLKNSEIKRKDITAIGFHGQTLDHFPPSIADGAKPYTLQIGNPQLLADKTGIDVVFDFRSADILAGGEGAPLAPVHNKHLAEALSLNRVAFCNAGNTGNIALITHEETLGWDVGPFNHFPDLLCRTNFGQNMDTDGNLGRGGKVSEEILRLFYMQSALNVKGRNFLEQTPPKSSDPSWYRLPKGLERFNKADVLRTAEYFSAYNFALSLRFVPKESPMPLQFLLFGGGWQNPLCLADFKEILQKRTLKEVLHEHEAVFEKIWERCLGIIPQIELSDHFGISGKYMEARLMADAAFCFLEKRPFTEPAVTGCQKPCICGALFKKGEDKQVFWSRAAKNGK